MAVVPVFVSSTFRDFHAERDVLRSHVAPALDAVLAPLGARVELLDLRWGVDTTTLATAVEAHRKVLGVCLDEINRCHPLFVGLLGERFGWVPEPADLRRAIQIATTGEGLPDLADLGLSVTALEFWVGALASDSDAVFAIRLPGEGHPPAWRDPDAAPVAWLRRQIELAHDAEPERVALCRYRLGLIDGLVSSDDLDIFASMLVERLTPLVVERARLLMSDQASPYDAAMARADVPDTVVGRDSELSQLVAHLTASDSPHVLLTGPSGMGKSTVVMGVANRLTHDGWTVARVSIGIAPGSTSPSDIAIMVGAQLGWQPLAAGTLGSTPGDEAMAEWWRVNLGALSAGTVIVLDGLDRIESGEGRDLLPFLGPDVLGGPVRFLVTSAEPTHAPLLAARGMTVSTLGPLSRDGVREVARLWSLSDGRRELPPRVLEAFASSPRSGLWVRLAVSELAGLTREDFERAERNLGGMAADAALEQVLVERATGLPDRDADLASRVLGRVARVVAHDGAAASLFGALAITRSGLAPSSLAAVSQMDALAVTRARWALGAQLVELDATGRLSFAHPIVRAAAHDWIVDFDEMAAHRQLCALLDADSADRTDLQDRLWHSLHGGDPTMVGRSIFRLSNYQVARPVLVAVAREPNYPRFMSDRAEPLDPRAVDATVTGMAVCLFEVVWEACLGSLASVLLDQAEQVLDHLTHQWPPSAVTLFRAVAASARVYRTALWVHHLSDEDAATLLTTVSEAQTVVETLLPEDSPERTLILMQFHRARLEVARCGSVEQQAHSIAEIAKDFWEARDALRGAQDTLDLRAAPPDHSGPQQVLQAHVRAVNEDPDAVSADGWLAAVSAARELHLADPRDQERVAMLASMLDGAGWALAEAGHSTEALDCWLQVLEVPPPESGPIEHTLAYRGSARISLETWVLDLSDEADALLHSDWPPAATARDRHLPELTAMVERMEQALQRARARGTNVDTAIRDILRYDRRLIDLAERIIADDRSCWPWKGLRRRVVGMRDELLDVARQDLAAAEAALEAHEFGAAHQMAVACGLCFRRLGAAGLDVEAARAWLRLVEVSALPAKSTDDALLRWIVAPMPEPSEPPTQWGVRWHVDRLAAVLTVINGERRHERVREAVLDLLEECAEAVSCWANDPDRPRRDRLEWADQGVRAVALAQQASPDRRFSRTEVIARGARASVRLVTGDDAGALTDAKRTIETAVRAGAMAGDSTAHFALLRALVARAECLDALDSPFPVIFRSRSSAARAAWRAVADELAVHQRSGWGDALSAKEFAAARRRG